MAEPFTAQTTPSQITGLVSGKKYVIQNTGKRKVYYTNSATDPSGDSSVAWFTCLPDAFFTTGVYDSGNPVWVWSPEQTPLTIGEI